MSTRLSPSRRTNHGASRCARSGSRTRWRCPRLVRRLAEALRSSSSGHRAVTTSPRVVCGWLSRKQSSCRTRSRLHSLSTTRTPSRNRRSPPRTSMRREWDGRVGKVASRSWAHCATGPSWTVATHLSKPRRSGSSPRTASASATPPITAATASSARCGGATWTRSRVERRHGRATAPVRSPSSRWAVRARAVSCTVVSAGPRFARSIIGRTSGIRRCSRGRELR